MLSPVLVPINRLFCQRILNWKLLDFGMDVILSPVLVSLLKWRSVIKTKFHIILGECGAVFVVLLY